jgi:aryl-alcohol dehydrogenase-like predicted oxidoreductase
MRLPADEALAVETIEAAAAAGMTVFDTAHAYGGNEGWRGRFPRRADGAPDRDGRDDVPPARGCRTAA